MAVVTNPGDVVFAIGAFLMAYDFFIKLQPFFPNFKPAIIMEEKFGPSAVSSS